MRCRASSRFQTSFRLSIAFASHFLLSKCTPPSPTRRAVTLGLKRTRALRRYVEVMQRVRGMKLLSVLNRARERGKRPACPAVAVARHAVGGIGLGWDGVFGTMFKAWGVMLLRHGHYHSDPHPGNFMLAKDGRLAILDWGQTQVAPESYRLHVCRLVLAMVAEDYPRVADEVRRSPGSLKKKNNQPLKFPTDLRDSRTTNSLNPCSCVEHPAARCDYTRKCSWNDPPRRRSRRCATRTSTRDPRCWRRLT